MTKRTRKKRTRTRMTVINPPSLSLFLHGNGAVDLIDDDDENDETLYRVSHRWNDNEDDWNAMLSRAQKRAAAVRGSHRQTSGAGLHDGILPDEALLYPHTGDKPIWRLRCHVSPYEYSVPKYIEQYTSQA